MRPSLLLVGLVASTLICGCGPSETRTNPENSHIKNIAVMYGQYLGSHKGQPPANEQVFRKFIQMNIDAQQAKATVDEWLTSPRDGELYTIRFGASGKTDSAVFVYEKKGKNGKRFVGFSNGQVDEVDEAKFKELVPGG